MIRVRTKINDSIESLYEKDAHMEADLLGGLADIWRLNGVAPLRTRRIEASDLPPLERRLLDHSDRMTPTLEHHHGTRLALRVLGENKSGATYVRKVVLVTADTGRIVELAAIRIEMASFDAKTQDIIFEGRKPFGAVIAESGLVHHCAPAAFLEILPDGDLWRDLGRVGAARPLYGRRNLITGEDGPTIADVIEVLPPVED